MLPHFSLICFFNCARRVLAAYVSIAILAICNASTAGQVCGTIPDIGGNTISWKLGDGNDNGMIVITIQSLTNASNITTMKVPAGTFYF